MKEDEKETIKEGKIPEEWKQNLNKLAQKDRDGRWRVKYSKAKEKDGKKLAPISIPEYGYKDHNTIDRSYGMIRAYHVTPANTHDGTQLFNVIHDNKCKDLWGDSVYFSEENERRLKEKGLRSRIHRKKKRGKKLPKNVARSNHKKSKVRAFVEHPYAYMKCQMSLFIRTIGIKRAEVKIGMANICYNLHRAISLCKKYRLSLPRSI